jgi:hypothetical protein
MIVFPHVSHFDTARLAHVVGLEMHTRADLVKDFYYSISFDNLYKGHTFQE